MKWNRARWHCALERLCRILKWTKSLYKCIIFHSFASFRLMSCRIIFTFSGTKRDLVWYFNVCVFYLWSLFHFFTVLKVKILLLYNLCHIWCGFFTRKLFFNIFQYRYNKLFIWYSSNKCSDERYSWIWNMHSLHTTDACFWPYSSEDSNVSAT